MLRGKITLVMLFVSEVEAASAAVPVTARNCLRCMILILLGNVWLLKRVGHGRLPDGRGSEWSRGERTVVAEAIEGSSEWGRSERAVAPEAIEVAGVVGVVGSFGDFRFWVRPRRLCGRSGVR